MITILVTKKTNKLKSWQPSNCSVVLNGPRLTYFFPQILYITLQRAKIVSVTAKVFSAIPFNIFRILYVSLYKMSRRPIKDIEIIVQLQEEERHQCSVNKIFESTVLSNDLSPAWRCNSSGLLVIRKSQGYSSFIVPV